MDVWKRQVVVLLEPRIRDTGFLKTCGIAGRTCEAIMLNEISLHPELSCYSPSYSAVYTEMLYIFTCIHCHSQNTRLVKEYGNAVHIFSELWWKRLVSETSN